MTSGDDPLAGFKPKDASDYTARLVGRSLVKSRRHEKLVNDFALHCAKRGFIAATEHPKDLVLTQSHGTALLVEAKVLYRGNATEAVRAAVGQLLSYSYFLYESDRPDMIALFSESVGAAYVQFLTSLGVATVWQQDGQWQGAGSPSLTASLMRREGLLLSTVRAQPRAVCARPRRGVDTTVVTLL